MPIFYPDRHRANREATAAQITPQARQRRREELHGYELGQIEAKGEQEMTRQKAEDEASMQRVREQIGTQREIAGMQYGPGSIAAKTYAAQYGEGGTQRIGTESEAKYREMMGKYYEGETGRSERAARVKAVSEANKYIMDPTNQQFQNRLKAITDPAERQRFIEQTRRGMIEEMLGAEGYDAPAGQAEAGAGGAQAEPTGRYKMMAGGGSYVGPGVGSGGAQPARAPGASGGVGGGIATARNKQTGEVLYFIGNQQVARVPAPADWVPPPKPTAVGGSSPAAVSPPPPVPLSARSTPELMGKAALKLGTGIATNVVPLGQWASGMTWGVGQAAEAARRGYGVAEQAYEAAEPTLRAKSLEMLGEPAPAAFAPGPPSPQGGGLLNYGRAVPAPQGTYGTPERTPMSPEAQAVLDRYRKRRGFVTKPMPLE
jgi:hypothetical protein